MALLTLAEAKAQLDIETTMHDQELTAYINALTPIVERYIGPVENRTITETLDSKGLTLAVTQVPAVSLTSITPVLAGGLALGMDDVALDGAAGIIRRVNGSFFGGGPWQVVYVAGRGEIHPTINVAARILLQHLWRTQYGAARGASGSDDFDVNEPVVGWGYAIPNRVLQMLEAFKVPPGVA
ncbi:head-tail connector protein [Streptomyces sp. NPDC053493]|uniref:head-tail connector protein n=1 Tax=Streptomyces sp. NPDC053493 TaxID=3365705 RepID=UPI0037D1E8DD